MKYITLLVFMFVFSAPFNCHNDGGLVGESVPQAEAACLRFDAERFPLSEFGGGQ